MTQKKCLDNIDNYANKGNGIDLENSLTCRFTWYYLEDSDQLIILDQSTIPAGDSIDTISIDVKDQATTINTPGAAASPVTIDVSTLDNTQQWRIDYSIESTNGLTCDVSIFIDPTDKECITASSDPNCKPLPFSTLFPGVTSHPVQHYTQSFAAVATWSVTHNTGNPDPLSIQVYDAAGDILNVGRSNITANSFDIVFGAAMSGSVRLIFTNP